ncbi:MAG: putative polymerase subfamily sigma factor [Acidimicrobiales bacterium]|nr:putative polymerase subfamily sigma factor [Acidimicrobiales bacterium]
MTPAEMYDKYADELIRYATVVAGPSSAEDVFSSAFARCVERVDWSEVRDPRGYLYRAVLNEARGQRRAAQRRLRRDAMDAAGRRDEDSTTFVRSEVFEAMHRLAARERAVIFLTYWGDLTVGEIAHRLDTSERTVARDLAKARRLLEELLS